MPEVANESNLPIQSGQITALLDLVVMRALAKKPKDRYGTAWEMVND